jgi:hypothetical protein
MTVLWTGGNPEEEREASFGKKQTEGIVQGAIKELILDDCGLGTAGLTELEQLIANHSCLLKSLSVWNTGMDAALRRRWQELVQGHQNIMSIGLPEPIVNMHLATPVE